MEAKKRFSKASTSGSQNQALETGTPIEVDPSMLTIFLETCMKLLRNRRAMKGLQEITKKCTGKENSPNGHRIVKKNGKHKAIIGCKMRLTTEIGDY